MTYDEAIKALDAVDKGQLRQDEISVECSSEDQRDEIADQARALLTRGLVKQVTAPKYAQDLRVHIKFQIPPTRAPR